MEKKERRRVLIHRQKSYLTAGVVTLVAVVAMMGAYQYEKRAEKQEQQEQVTLAEQTDTAETQNTTNADDTQETMVAQTRRQYISRYRPMKNRCCTLRRQIPLAGRWRAM